MEDCNKLLTRLTEPGPWNLWDKVLSRRVSSRPLDTHFGKKYNETSRTQDSSTATTAFSTPLNLFNVTPELTQAAISQKPDKESLTPPPPLNPAFLTPPPTVGFSDLVKISFFRKYVFCTRSRKRWYFCTASGGTSKNLELKGKFLEYLRQLS